MYKNELLLVLDAMSAAIRSFRSSSAAALRSRWRETGSIVNKTALQATLDNDNHDERSRFWKDVVNSEVHLTFCC